MLLCNSNQTVLKSPYSVLSSMCGCYFTFVRLRFVHLWVQLSTLSGTSLGYGYMRPPGKLKDSKTSSGSSNSTGSEDSFTEATIAPA